MDKETVFILDAISELDIDVDDRMRRREIEMF